VKVTFEFLNLQHSVNNMVTFNNNVEAFLQEDHRGIKKEHGSLQHSQG